MLFGDDPAAQLYANIQQRRCIEARVQHTQSNGYTPTDTGAQEHRSNDVGEPIFRPKAWLFAKFR